MKSKFDKFSDALKDTFQRISDTIKLRFESRTLTWKSFLIKSIAFVFLFAILSSACVFTISLSIVSYSKSNIVEKGNLSSDQKYDCILVLGAKVKENSPSHMLEDRLKTGIELYLNGAAPVLLFSGDSENPESYDETAAMKSYALSAGIPESAIVCDPYGLSTFDSIRRAKELYGYKEILIVTQEYHLYRAIYIAEKLELDAGGVSADLRTYRGQFIRDAREVLARFKDFFYVLLDKEAKYTE